jgi:hypothetical protein
MSTTAQDVMAKLIEAGWPAELGDARWSAMTTRIAKAAANGDPPHLGIAELEYDTETIYGLGPSRDPNTLDSYTDLITLYAQHSWGVLAPTHIVDTFDEGTNNHTIGFTLGEQTFSATFESMSDWVSPAFEKLMNEALEKVGAKERFLLVPYPDQIAYVAFVSEAAMKRAEDVGALPTMDEMIAAQMGDL